MNEKKVSVVESETTTPGDGRIHRAYDAPQMFPIGDASKLLRGSGRHKTDDTGSRGFEVG